ncbi:hypothetical protein [Marinifilum flexuosum]|uniref:Uncharacterized protein n=1 Tax=Marinifilum flexuosum TaxID=1117708 RepID=A0A419X6F0_9BACT|nr:hypothetical protein [Marinifilum flexuosum]RKE03318.1 hypothetical protein BXY64_0311 [Marinifilum flexuosum]
MKSLLKDKILRYSLLTLTVVAFSIESKAQLLTIDKFLLPFFKIEYNNSGESPAEEITNERGYLDNGILIFKENLKVCKDIVSGNKEDYISPKLNIDTSLRCKTCKDTITVKQNTTIITSKKKRSKNFRNFPGNIRSTI